MPSKYESTRDRVNTFIQKNVLGILRKTALDLGVEISYELMIQEIIQQTGCNEKLARDMLDSYVKSGKIIHHSFIELPESEVDALRKTRDEIAKQLKEEDKKAMEVLESGPSNINNSK